MSPGSEPEDALLTLEVANVAAGPNSAYCGVLYPSDAPDVRIEGYPRWSEPAGALCTRLLALALGHTAPGLGGAVGDGLEVLVRIVPFGYRPPRELERFVLEQGESGWCARGPDAAGHPACWELSLERQLGSGAFALAALAHIYWGGTSIPAPQVVTPRIYRAGQIAYIRTGELPEPARSAFERNIARSARPLVAGAFDAAYAWDWEDFLAGAR